MRLLAAAADAPLAEPGVEYPDWYVHRWHFLPEGYFSRRSVALYNALIRRLYWALREREGLREVARSLRGRERILELGCGPGHGLAFLSRASRGARITGVDLSPFMLEQAQVRALGVELVHANSLALPFERPEFDAIVALHHLGHLPESERPNAWREWTRVLEPGGIIVLVEHRWHRLHPVGVTLRRTRSLAAGIMRLTVWEPSRPSHQGENTQMREVTGA